MVMTSNYGSAFQHCATLCKEQTRLFVGGDEAGPISRKHILETQRTLLPDVPWICSSTVYLTKLGN